MSTENTAKHTKGPWWWRRDLGDWYLSPGILIAEGTDGTPGGDELDEANAHLIAAAPEMYEALHNLLAKLSHYEDALSAAESDERWHFEVSPAMRAASAAIARARGEQP